MRFIVCFLASSNHFKAGFSYRVLFTAGGHSEERIFQVSLVILMEVLNSLPSYIVNTFSILQVAYPLISE
ncbi:hypothetical protein NDU88_009526 [Pleurodeles waltl]|uniref:Uncharacterized protein n=1 Tax=Pleurodeles waltl TaxID=8319 RepID=A0AAV7PSB6_PLEWA|nr:hypothetical protein NDU88_009526 [Pleurodeles waltl]